MRVISKAALKLPESPETSLGGVRVYWETLELLCDACSNTL